jgi:hypothetical protein
VLTPILHPLVSPLLDPTDADNNERSTETVSAERDIEKNGPTGRQPSSTKPVVWPW